MEKRFIILHGDPKAWDKYNFYVIDTEAGKCDWESTEDKDDPDYWAVHVCGTDFKLWAERIANALNSANEKAEVYPPL